MKTAVLLILLMAASCGGKDSGGRDSGGQEAGPADSVRECQKDSDCALVKKTCCPCESGGVMMALPKRLKTSHLKKLQSACREPVICPQWFRCGEWKAAECADSKCRAAPAGAQK